MKKELGEISEKQLIEELRGMPVDKYRSLAETISMQLKAEEIDFGDATDISLEVQKVWSDRLIGSSASEYGKLLAAVSQR